ncbi:hypothetical protein BDP27DRAFT_1365706 [Rhodocollybia butyracea]|uniref:Uncharacterized protein n=1 Tax=Rhodocollybia butyracea TaxID=206335 RepID=A0A9P5U533_9AGAR|nr:hypothetical protein BDP27DRAFT_1365706 [Rhodocollybia butyracea]
MSTKAKSERSEPCFRFVPMLESYISFSLDVRQTLDLLRCDIDDDTEQAIQNFSIRKYVALIQSYPTLPMPDRPYERIGLRLLQQGLPDPVPEVFFEPYMSYPVAPENFHPLNRPPVHTNKPLPWEGCYHASCLDASVFLPQSRPDYANAFHMVHSDWLRTYQYGAEDIGIVRAKQRKAKFGSQVDLVDETEEQLEEPLEGPELDDDLPEDPCLTFLPPSERLPYTPLDLTKYKFDSDGNIDWLAEYDDDESVSGSLSHDSTDTGKDGWSDEDSLLDGNYGAIPINSYLKGMMPFSGDMPDGRFIPVVNFSPDLSGIPSLHSIEQYYKDFDALEALVRKCQLGPPMPAYSVADDEHAQILTPLGAPQLQELICPSIPSLSVPDGSESSVYSSVILKQDKKAGFLLKASRVARKLFISLFTD